MEYARLKVLVAVSSEQLTKKLRAFFEDQAVADVQCVNSMYDAADLMNRGDFNLFVLDGQLLYAVDHDKARVAGVDFIRFIRMCEGPVAEAPVLFLRSRRSTQLLLEAHAEVEEARDAGANAILGQPFELHVFDESVQKIVNKSKDFIRAPLYVGPCRREESGAVDEERRGKTTR